MKISGVLEQDPTKPKLKMAWFVVFIVPLMLAGYYLVVQSCK
jgi:hypothetical protein